MVQDGRRKLMLYLLSPILIAAILAFYTRNRRASRSHTTLRSLEEAIQTYDFVETADEIRCASEQDQKVETVTPIPNTVHFIYGLIPDGAELPFFAYLAIRSAIMKLKPDTVKLHHTYINPKAIYVERLLQLASLTKVELVYRDPILTVHGRPSRDWHVAHLSDVLRLEILYFEGGIYLDSDVFTLQSFGGLRHSPRNLILGHEGGNRWGAANAVIIARPRAEFLRRWMDRYSSDFNPREWNKHSVILPKQLAEEFPKEACLLSPVAFFWPTWTAEHVKYMHENTTAENARDVWLALERNGGTLFKGQYAYHA